MSVDAQGRIELGLLDDDVAQAAFLGLTADGDVKIALQRPDRCINQCNGFPTFPLLGFRVLSRSYAMPALM